MSDWKPDWGPGREIPLEQIKQELDRQLPRYTDGCKIAGGDPTCTVSIDVGDFRLTPRDLLLLGMAVAYSHRLNAQFVSIPNKDARPTVNFSPVPVIAESSDGKEKS